MRIDSSVLHLWNEAAESDRFEPDYAINSTLQPVCVCFVSIVCNLIGIDLDTNGNFQ